MSLRLNKTLILIVFFFLFTTALQAQWRGDANVQGGWDLKANNTENANFNIRYTGNKFYIGANVSVGHNYLPSTQSTSIIDAKKQGDEYYKGEEKAMKPENATVDAGLNFGFKFNQANTLDASLGYNYKGKEDYPVLSTERYGVSDNVLVGSQLDTILNRSHKIDGKIVYKHYFEGRPEAKLAVAVNNLSSVALDNNSRVTSGDFYLRPKHYATYSNLIDYDSKMAVSYDDVFRFDGSVLKLKAGMDIMANQDVDKYSARTMVNGQWRDSTKYRQSYLYSSLSIEPFANLTLTVGKFDFSLNERIQRYRHSLIDRLEERSQSGDIAALFDKQNDIAWLVLEPVLK